MLQLHRTLDMRDQGGEQLDVRRLEVADAPGRYSRSTVVTPLSSRVLVAMAASIAAAAPIPETARPGVFVAWHEQFGVSRRAANSAATSGGTGSDRPSAARRHERSPGRDAARGRPRSSLLHHNALGRPRVPRRYPPGRRVHGPAGGLDRRDVEVLKDAQDLLDQAVLRPLPAAKCCGVPSALPVAERPAGWPAAYLLLVAVGAGRDVVCASKAGSPRCPSREPPFRCRSDL